MDGIRFGLSNALVTSELIDVNALVRSSFFKNYLLRRGFDGVLIREIKSSGIENHQVHPFYMDSILAISNEQRMAKAVISETVYRGVADPAYLLSGAQGMASISFCIDKNAAIAYAQSAEHGSEPCVIKAIVNLYQPLPFDRHDPFIQVGDFSDWLNDDVGTLHFLMKFKNHLTNTDSWGGFVDELCLKFPHVDLMDTEETIEFSWINTKEAIKERLCLQVWPLLDDREFIDIAMERGFDGAVYQGSGITTDTTEVRVFEGKSVSVIHLYKDDEFYALCNDMKPLDIGMPKARRR